jgi:hypothetical protein
MDSQTSLVTRKIKGRCMICLQIPLRSVKLTEVVFGIVGRGSFGAGEAAYQ